MKTDHICKIRGHNMDKLNIKLVKIAENEKEIEIEGYVNGSKFMPSEKIDENQ